VNWLTRANRWLVAGLAVGVFLAEHFTPTAAHVGVAYVAVVMLSLWSTRSSDIYLAGALATLLVFAELLVARTPPPPPVAAANLLAILFAIWLTVAACAGRRRESRARTENALRESEQRFRLATDALNGFVFERDIVTGRSIRAGRLLKQLGLETAIGVRLDGEDLRALIHPDDRERVLKYLGDARFDSSAQGIEYRLRDIDGEYRRPQPAPGHFLAGRSAAAHGRLGDRRHRAKSRRAR